MRSGKIQFNRGEKGQLKPFTFIVSLIIAVVGFVISQPFIWVVIIGGHAFRSFTFTAVLMLIGAIIGMPAFIAGILGMLTAGRSNASPSTYNDHDVARIRHSVEMDRMNK